MNTRSGQQGLNNRASRIALLENILFIGLLLLLAVMVWQVVKTVIRHLIPAKKGDTQKQHMLLAIKNQQLQSSQADLNNTLSKNSNAAQHEKKPTHATNLRSQATPVAYPTETSVKHKNNFLVWLQKTCIPELEKLFPGPLSTIKDFGPVKEKLRKLADALTNDAFIELKKKSYSKEFKSKLEIFLQTCKTLHEHHQHLSDEHCITLLRLMSCIALDGRTHHQVWRKPQKNPTKKMLNPHAPTFYLANK